MKKSLYIILILFIFMYPSIVDAQTTTTEAVCSYSDQAELNKLAYNVTANYSIVNDNGKQAFKITVYNITGDLYVTIDSDLSDNPPVTVHPQDTKGGSFSIIDTNLTELANYKIAVRTTREGCISDIRKFTLIKPMKNKYHTTSLCQYNGMEEYYYCREWITSEYTISEDEIKRKIETELAKIKTTGATRCISCEEEELQAAARKKFLETKSMVMKILVVLIVINIIVLAFFYQRARSYDL